MKLNSYRDLIAWQRSMDLAVLVYNVSKSFPREEIYGLTSQLRRASVSIPSNIAEGAERRTSGEFLQFLGTAQGSLAEVETQLLLCNRLNILPDEKCDELMEKAAELGRILSGLQYSISRRKSKSQGAPELSSDD